MIGPTGSRKRGPSIKNRDGFDLNEPLGKRKVGDPNRSAGWGFARPKRFLGVGDDPPLLEPIIQNKCCCFDDVGEGRARGLKCQSEVGVLPIGCLWSAAFWCDEEKNVVPPTMAVV